MRLCSLVVGTRPLVAGRSSDGALLDLTAADPGLGPDVGALLRSGTDWRARAEAAAAAAGAVSGLPRFRPVVPTPGKLLCVGLNDVDHAAEAGLPIPELPELFVRVASSLIGHGQPMLRPVESAALDYEGELAVIIGTGGRRVPRDRALEHVAGYSVFNDGSIRDFQLRTSQWTLGKNFHGTGALGPDLVTSDELPPGARGLRLTTRIGDELLQDGNTDRFVFDVARVIELVSEAMVLEPGDVIAMGTPSGIGYARTPPRFMRPGETCRVAIERIGELDNPIADDEPPGAR